eukprot:Gb_16403 [translate_table: standard]
MNIGNLYFPSTNPSLSMPLTISSVLLLVHFVTKNEGGNFIPNAWQSLVEPIHDFMLNLVNEQIGGLSKNVKQKFSPRMSVTFTSLSFRNPQGMIPHSSTVMSHFIITSGPPFFISIGITIMGLKEWASFLQFSSLIGVPLSLAPPLVLPKIIAGHTLVRISSGSS